MQTVLDIIGWLGTNYQAVIAGVIGVLTGLTGIFMLIPGEQPEKALQGIVDFLSKFSKK